MRADVWTYLETAVEEGLDEVRVVLASDGVLEGSQESSNLIYKQLEQTKATYIEVWVVLHHFAEVK